VIAPPEVAYELTNSLETTPDTPDTIEIEFLAGVPVALNGVSLSLSELIIQLNTLAGKHGVAGLTILKTV